MGSSSSKGEEVKPQETEEEKSQRLAEIAKEKQEALRLQAEADKVLGTFEFPKKQLPIDSEGYCKSFSLDEEQELLSFFDEFGFVVINNVLTKEEVEKTIIEIWDALEEHSWGWEEKDKVLRDDPRTWTNDFWPQAIMKLGILGDRVASGKCAFQNRQNPNVYKAFSLVYKRKDLWASLDRYGIMRPTKNVPLAALPDKAKARTSAQLTADTKIEVKDYPEWKTAEAWLHWDLNPWKWTGTTEGNDYSFTNFITENNGSKNDGNVKVQGLINLGSSREGDGGFFCVPGYHKYLRQWCEKTLHTSYCKQNDVRFEFVGVHKDDALKKQGVPITTRPGSLVIWNSELPHCNYPNNSNQFRLNQYLKMLPQHEGAKGIDNRIMQMKLLLPKDFEVSELGKKNFWIRKLGQRNSRTKNRLMQTYYYHTYSCGVAGVGLAFNVD